MTRWAVTALVVLVLLASGGLQTHPARAHANLASAEPAPDARTARPPAELVLRFTQDLDRSGSWVQLRDGSGTNMVQSLSFDDADARRLLARVGPLEPGLYRVVWQSLSAEDGDYADGSYEFVVLNADGSLPREAEGGAPLQDADDDGKTVTTLLAVVIGAVVVGGALLFALRYKRTA